MDDKLVEQLTKHINESKRNFRYEQVGLTFLSTVERSTTTKINNIKNEIILPESRGRVNPFFMPFTGLAKINSKKDNTQKSAKAS